MGLFRALEHHVARRMLELREGVRTDLSECIGRVVMRGQEIHWQVVFVAMGEEFRNPGVLRARRTADLEPRIDVFDCFRGRAIEMVIALLTTGPERFQVGLVPYL